MQNQIMIPISIGELMDKITILQIKSIKIKNTQQLHNINHELTLLTDIVNSQGINRKKLYKEYLYMLHEINVCLWNVEEELRRLEKLQQFDEYFTDNARKVYEFNDRRAKVKKDINILYGSSIVEEKSYDNS